MSNLSYDALYARIETLSDDVRSLRAENKKLLAVANAAGEYLDAKFWDDDEIIEAAGEALANAMNAWKR